jgi:hypothetical protein
VVAHGLRVEAHAVESDRRLIHQRASESCLT